MESASNAQHGSPHGPFLSIFVTFPPKKTLQNPDPSKPGDDSQGDGGNLAQSAAFSFTPFPPLLPDSVL